jgi:inhibitor of the pro-sigma K processing machinery
MDAFVWLVGALGVGFVALLLYSRQFRWLGRVGRNMLLGTGGMLAANAALATAGLAVGVNLITALVVGVLGVPGFLMLYLAQLMVG